MLRHIVQLSTLILTFYLPEQMNIHGTLVKEFFDLIRRLNDERGIAFTVKYIKTCRLAVTRYITGHPLDVLDGVALVNGWPKAIDFLKPLINSRDELKLLMTLLISLRGIHLSPELDVTSIISPWKGTDSITDRELDHVCRLLKIRPTSVDWSKFHMSTKKGPLGQAILTSVTELTLLPHELLTNIKLIGGDKLSRVIDNLMVGRFGDLSLASIWATLFKPKTKSFRKLSYFSDKEGKTRVIAILDYWSQTSLRPLHDTLNGILRRIKQDCTFDQNNFLTVLHSLSPYYSLDLSNATDRMPIVLQQRVLERVIGKEKAAAWAHILVGYEFASKGHPNVSYNAGQPMGAYSSWCAMALTHHVLVLVSALRAGKPHFKDYVILGDDLVIANADVAEQYKILLSQLDMPISVQKTHVSENTYEFAKRWIHKQEEITGFSIAGLFSVWGKYALLHNYLTTQRHHGWNLENVRHPELIAAIYKLFGKPQQASRVIKLYMVFDKLALAKSTGSYLELMNEIDLRFGIHVLPAFELFSTSNSSTELGDPDFNNLGRLIHVEAAKRLVERDFERFQKDAYAVSAKLTGRFLSHFPDLDVQSYRAALRGNHPLVTVLNNMIIDSVQILTKEFGKSVGITTARSGQYQAIAGSLQGNKVPDDSYLNIGLSKYFVSKGVFSMRASHSLTLADSMLLKSLLDVSREYTLGKWTPSIVEDVVSEGQVQEVVRKYRVVHKPSGPTIYLPAAT